MRRPSSAATSIAPSSPPERIEIHVPPEEEGPGTMQIVETDQAPWELIVPNTRGGDIYRKVIRAAEGGDRVSYDVRIERFSKGDLAYTSIRHRHDFEQLRFAVSGKMDLGVETLEQGEVGYFPANAYYGPQRCEDAIILIAQWGDHFITKSDSDRAVAELAATGKFTDGIYRSVDAEGKPFNKDPLNAIWEHVFQRPFKPQRPRYKQPVVMSPGAFGWDDAERPIRSRRLGSFTENEVEIEFLSWIDDATFEGPADDVRPTLLFTTVGEFRHGERLFGSLTGVWIEPGESVTLAATAGSELMKVKFPGADSRITLATTP
ncbi:hypothetical protein [Dactylosporangium sp. NPDC051484]|uniref:hypothetical protein n=1 Tax=Dactylosporangium sp. NPDC051484 TaxID=3154942 RepID=UPI00344E520C